MTNKYKHPHCEPSRFWNVSWKLVFRIHQFIWVQLCQVTVVTAQGYTDKPSFTLHNPWTWFIYRRSAVSSNISLDMEISTRMGKVATIFVMLNKRVWDKKHLTAWTKAMVYQTCVHIYSCMLWRPGHCIPDSRDS